MDNVTVNWADQKEISSENTSRIEFLFWYAWKAQLFPGMQGKT